MSNKIQQAFEPIRATDRMKDTAVLILSEKVMQQSGQRPGMLSRPLAAICSVLVLWIGIGGWYLWEKPVSYVSVDVNPSIELTLNRLNRVTGVESRNAEGESVLKDLRLLGRDYIEAVELLVESDGMQEYLTVDADLILTVASPKEEEILTGLKSSVVSTHYQGMCRRADLANVTSAHECGMSLGKYEVYQRLSQYDESITAEECQHMTMHQLHLRLSQYDDDYIESHSCDGTGEDDDGCAEGRHHCESGHHQ